MVTPPETPPDSDIPVGSVEGGQEPLADLVVLDQEGISPTGPAVDLMAEQISNAIERAPQTPVVLSDGEDAED